MKNEGQRTKHRRKKLIQVWRKMKNYVRISNWTKALLTKFYK